MEGLLIGNADDAHTAELCGCDVDDVRAYHDLFFDVKPRLMTPGWVVAQLFQGSLYGALNPRDRIAQLHRVAWLGGYEIFTAFYTGRKSPEILGQVVALRDDILVKQSMLASMCIAMGGENSVELLKISIETTQRQVAETASGGNEEMANAMMGFLQSIPLTVADPTDASNVTLPAREPRSTLYQVQSEV